MRTRCPPALAWPPSRTAGSAPWESVTSCARRPRPLTLTRTAVRSTSRIGWPSRLQPCGAVGASPLPPSPSSTIRAGASATAVHDTRPWSRWPSGAAPAPPARCSPAPTAKPAPSRRRCGLVRRLFDRQEQPDRESVRPGRDFPVPLELGEPSFTVVAGAASKVLFSVQPVATSAGLVFATSPAVAITDAGGNVATTGTDSTRSITLSIGSNPGGGTLTCTGGLTRAAVAGVATFTGCSINNAGVGYTLVATSPASTRRRRMPSIWGCSRRQSP